MSLDEAKKLYDLIDENEDLQEEFKGLESKEEVIGKALEVANNKEFDVSREDVEKLLENLAEPTGELDEEELEEVAGGYSSCRVCVMKNSGFIVSG